MGRDSILVLFAPAGIDHRLEETAPAELRGVPCRPRQRTDDRGRQHDAGGRFVHGVVSLEALCEPQPRPRPSTDIQFLTPESHVTVGLAKVPGWLSGAYPGLKSE